MKRKYIPIHDAIKQARECNPDLPENSGVCACYDVENMGYCKDGKTRWYHFDDISGEPAYTLKY